MRDNSVSAKTIGGGVQVAGFFLAGVCALLILGACSQKLAMLQPATSKLATYHVKELVMHVEGISRSESLQEADKLSSAIKTAIDRELRTTLRGTNPANAIIRFKKIADHKTYFWTDKAGVVHHDALSYVDYYVNLTLRDDRTHDVVAEQWFSVDRGDLFTQLDEWLSLGRDEQLNRWSSRLAEKVRLWIGSTDPRSTRIGLGHHYVWERGGPSMASARLPVGGSGGMLARIIPGGGTIGEADVA